MNSNVYLRIRRGPRFVNLDVSEMTDEEIDHAMAKKDAPELRRWVSVLARIIREAPDARKG